MVVAGAEMRVAAHAAALAPHHQAEFGVGLELGETEHDLHASRFERASEADIGLLVEPGAQLDHRRDRLAAFRRLDQRLDDRAVARRAIQRLLDRHHGGIQRRLAQELHHHVEALERMMHDDVLGADRREAVAAEIADPLGEARHVGREQQVGAVVDDQLLDVDDADQPVMLLHLGLLDVELVGDQLGEFRRHRGIHVEMDHHAAAAALERGLVGAHKILGLLLELDVGVADHPEHALAADMEAGEQPVEEHSDQILENHEAGLMRRGQATVAARRQPYEALDLAGQHDQPGHDMALVVIAQQPEHQPQAHVGDERERMRRIDRQRRQDRKDPFHEAGLEPGAILVVERVDAEHVDADRAQAGAELLPDALLVGEQGAGALRHRGELLRRRAAVGRALGERLAHLADQAGDPHRIELVEIAGADGQEADPLEQRIALVVGFLDHALVEIEPGELAVDEAVRRGEVDGRFERRLLGGAGTRHAAALRAAERLRRARPADRGRSRAGSRRPGRFAHTRSPLSCIARVYGRSARAGTGLADEGFRTGEDSKEGRCSFLKERTKELLFVK